MWNLNRPFDFHPIRDYKYKNSIRRLVQKDGGVWKFKSPFFEVIRSRPTINFY